MSSAGGNIFMENSHFFEYYFGSYFLRLSPGWQGLGATSGGIAGKMTARVIGLESGPV